jgi:hypothetical protein
MPDNSSATRSSLSSAASRLTGSLVTRVTYYGFSHWGEDWDHGQYHDATMGVELACPDDRRFVACRGDAFGHFGLEFLVAAAGDVFGNSPESRDFSQHDWWAPFTRLPVTAELAWRTGYADSDAPAPVAVSQRCGQHCVWIAAADRNDTSPSGFLLGMDAVLVTGDRAFAHSIGL